VTPDVAAADPQLRAFALTQAKPLYARYCADCHGADLRGERHSGAPNLRDSVWLFGDGSAFDIERTLLYGVRSGMDKSHNIADMPAFGTTAMLSDAQIRAVVQYVLQLSGQPYQPVAANDGKAVFDGPGGCFDCHGPRGGGNPDYGAPDLTANVWSSGGDADALYHAIYYGQHRRMPAWIGVLTLAQIRALAVYIHSMAATVTADADANKTAYEGSGE